MKLRQVAAAILAVSALATGGVARADLYPDFTVNPAAYGGSLPTLAWARTTAGLG